MSPPNLRIGNVWVGPKQPCFIVAELGVNHNGDLETAKRLIDAAARSGVRAVKLQRRAIDEILTAEAQAAPYVNERSFGATYGAHRRALELSDGAWRDLKRVANELGLMFFATPYDLPSVAFLGHLGVPAVKVASCDLTNPPLLKAVSEMGIPVLMSTGMATEAEIDQAVRVVWAGTDALVLMHCVSTYPAEAADLNLRYMLKLAKKYVVVCGYSGHERGIQTSLAAVVLGAAVLERHFTLDRTMKGPDHAASLEPEGLTRLVRDIRRIEEALIERPKKILPGERAARDRLAKSLVTARLIPAGAVIERAFLMAKGPGTGIAPYRLEEFVGKKAAVAIPVDVLLSEEMVE